MTKKELRKIYKDKRKQLTQKDILRLDHLLLIQFQQWPLGDIQTVLSYWPITARSEINTQLMLDYLAFRIPDLRVAFPVINSSENIFKPVLVDDNTEFLENEYGIAEPVDGQEVAATELDVIFVPLLAFDRNGFRVGYGKGFYDRFLTACREDALKIGLSYFGPEERINDIDDFDVPLSICITPNKIYEF